ncbi:MAG: glutathione S-transferase family protein [Deltaproteobacteria bacterium]|nr:glutathione S-transferase family protein [Deltaproteobacteria bacterium]MBK8719313.1 glutathione S-transferase family protein [Deltaproteobacteria bacterium]MBP7290009.1 glutathione S-transferase family protein [Nannocystaceae bacterium]
MSADAHHPALRLFGRRSSHFTRVAVIFADVLGIDAPLEVVHDLASVEAGNYGGNPTLKVPTLVIDGVPLFGTENICRRLVGLSGRAGDPRVVLTELLPDDRSRSAQELVWHAMSAQVQLRVGIHFAGLPADNRFFAKTIAGLHGALDWLDAQLPAVLAALPADRELSLFEVTLGCLLEHLAFRPAVRLQPPPHLRAFAASFAAQPWAQRSAYRSDAAPRPA